MERKKVEEFVPDVEFQSWIEVTMGLTQKCVEWDPDGWHKRTWDFVMKMRNLCPEQRNILGVGRLGILPVTTGQSTKVVPFLKRMTDAAGDNISG